MKKLDIYFIPDPVDGATSKGLVEDEQVEEEKED